MKRFQIDPKVKANQPVRSRLLSDNLKAIVKDFNGDSGGDLIITAEYLVDWRKRFQKLVELAIDYECLLNNERVDDDVIIAALHAENSNIILFGGDE